MELIQVKGNTYYLDGPQLTGVYRLEDGRCLLFDPGSGKLRAPIEEALGKAGLTPAGVVLTHMHYDHHENSRYFREKYGAAVVLPQLEADIVRCEQSLKNHLFNFTMGLIRSTKRLQSLICPDAQAIPLGQTQAEVAGVPLEVVRTPGHAPDHSCFITPDNVCFAGDVLMTQDILKDSMIPFVFDMTDDLASKEKMKALSCDAYILSHKGVVTGSIAALAEENIQRVLGQLRACAALVQAPMTYSAFYAAIIQAMDLPVGHPARALHLERYLRPYVEYLIDRGDLMLIDLDGAPAVAPGAVCHG